VVQTHPNVSPMENSMMRLLEDNRQEIRHQNPNHACCVHAAVTNLRVSENFFDEALHAEAPMIHAHVLSEEFSLLTREQDHDYVEVVETSDVP